MQIYDILKQKAVEDKIYSLVLGGIIINDDKILLVKRADNQFMKNLYEFPSGKLEFGETFKQCLERHVQEELNCRVTNVLGYAGHFDYLSDKGQLVRQYNFVLDVENLNEILLSSDHTNYGFFSVSECDNLIDISDEILYSINMVISNRILLRGVK